MKKLSEIDNKNNWCQLCSKYNLCEKSLFMYWRSDEPALLFSSNEEEKSSKNFQESLRKIKIFYFQIQTPYILLGTVYYNMYWITDTSSVSFHIGIW